MRLGGKGTVVPLVTSIRGWLKKLCSLLISIKPPSLSVNFSVSLSWTQILPSLQPDPPTFLHSLLQVTSGNLLNIWMVRKFRSPRGKLPCIKSKAVVATEVWSFCESAKAVAQLGSKVLLFCYYKHLHDYNNSTQPLQAILLTAISLLGGSQPSCPFVSGLMLVLSSCKQSLTDLSSGQPQY